MEIYPFLRIGGSGYVNPWMFIVNTLVDAGVEIAEPKDNRVKHDPTFNTQTKTIGKARLGPKDTPQRVSQ